MYEDNTAAKQLAHNPGALRDRSKHFELRWFKLQELVKGAIVTLKYIGTKEQVADALKLWHEITIQLQYSKDSVIIQL